MILNGLLLRPQTRLYWGLSITFGRILPQLWWTCVSQCTVLTSCICDTADTALAMHATTHQVLIATSRTRRHVCASPLVVLVYCTRYSIVLYGGSVPVTCQYAANIFFRWMLSKICNCVTCTDSGHGHCFSQMIIWNLWSCPPLIELILCMAAQGFVLYWKDNPPHIEHILSAGLSQRLETNPTQLYFSDTSHTSHRYSFKDPQLKPVNVESGHIS